MSRLSRASCFLLFFAMVQAEARADLRCAVAIADAGEVRSGQALSQEFRFVNEGPETIELIAAQPSCGCLKPRLGQRLLRPGESGTLLMEVHTLGQAAGPHSWQVRLQYRSDDLVREVLLQLTARIVTEISVQPAALTFFAHGALAQEVVLTDTRARPLDILELRTTSAHLRASLVEKNRDGAGQLTFRIALEIAADYPAGRHEEVLSLYTDDPLYQHLKVEVTVVHSPGQRLTVMPAEVAFTAAPGQPVAGRQLLVRDSRDEVVAIESVTADDPALQCRWAQGPENLATIRVQVDRARLSGPQLRSAIHIHIARPVRETLTVPVVAALE